MDLEQLFCVWLVYYRDSVEENKSWISPMDRNVLFRPFNIATRIQTNNYVKIINKEAKISFVIMAKTVLI